MRPELFWILAAAFALTALMFLGNTLLRPVGPPTAPGEHDLEARWRALSEALQAQGLDAFLVQEARRAFGEGRPEEGIGALNTLAFLLDGWERAGRLTPLDTASLRLELQRLLDALAPLVSGAPLCVGVYEIETGGTRLIGPFLREAPPTFRLRLPPEAEWTWRLQEQRCS